MFDEKIDEMRRESVILRIVGTMAILLAGLGIWYNLFGLSFFLLNREHDPETPYFLAAFMIMSTICIVCYILLIVTGVQFVRGKTGLARLFTGVLIFEVLYFFSIGIMWLMPKIGMSVGAATGVANGGLMFQVIILFPLWAPLAVRWAKRKQEESANNSM